MSVCITTLAEILASVCITTLAEILASVCITTLAVILASVQIDKDKTKEDQGRKTISLDFGHGNCVQFVRTT